MAINSKIDWFDMSLPPINLYNAPAHESNDAREYQGLAIGDLAIDSQQKLNQQSNNPINEHRRPYV